MPETHPNLADVLSEPSAEAFGGFNVDYGARSGKFIRMSGMILVAPMLGYGPDHKHLTHLDLFWDAVLFTPPDFSE